MCKESCAEKYGADFSPFLKTVFCDEGWSIPWMLEILEEHCEDRTCLHHVFWEGLVTARFCIAPHDEPWVLQCHRCMCLLDLVEDELSLADIARAYGVDKKPIFYYEKLGLEKLRAKFLEKEIGNSQEITEPLLITYRIRKGRPEKSEPNAVYGGAKM